MAKLGTILVTGATGRQGGAVAHELIDHGYEIKAMTRHPESPTAQELADRGAELVKADLDDAASLEKAMDGIWGVFAVQNTWEAGVEKEEEQGKRIARIAKDAGVQHYVYTSVASAQHKTGIPHFDNKFRVEQRVSELDFPSYTIIRPVFFMENWLSPWFKPAIDKGNIMVPLRPITTLQMVAVADIGKYGLWAFENHEMLNGEAIDFAGDSLTMPEAAKILSQATGRTIGFAQIPVEEVRKSSDDLAIMFEWFDNVGYNADIRGMAKKSGIKPTSFSDWAARVQWKEILEPAMTN